MAGLVSGNANVYSDISWEGVLASCDAGIMLPGQPGQDLKINDDIFLFSFHIFCVIFFKDPVSVAYDTCQIIVSGSMK